MLLSRLGGKDRMSLWKMQGSKKWEVDVSMNETETEEIIGLAWSPDGEQSSLRLLFGPVLPAAQDRALPWLMIPHVSLCILYRTVMRSECSPL